MLNVQVTPPVIVAGLLLGWQLMILVSLNSWCRSKLRHLRVRLFPKWTVFRGPFTTHALSYRDRLTDGTVTPWKPVATNDKATVRRALWYPRYWHFVAIFMLTTKLLRAIEKSEGNTQQLESDFCYRSIVHFLWHLPAGPDADQRQFRIVRSYGFFPTQAAEEVFLSESIEAAVPRTNSS